jgi:hypothetical protein
VLRACCIESGGEPSGIIGIIKEFMGVKPGDKAKAGLQI